LRLRSRTAGISICQYLGDSDPRFGGSRGDFGAVETSARKTGDVGADLRIFRSMTAVSSLFGRVQAMYLPLRRCPARGDRILPVEVGVSPIQAQPLRIVSSPIVTIPVLKSSKLPVAVLPRSERANERQLPCSSLERLRSFERLVENF